MAAGNADHCSAHLRQAVVLAWYKRVGETKTGENDADVVSYSKAKLENQTEPNVSSSAASGDIIESSYAWKHLAL